MMPTPWKILRRALAVFALGSVLAAIAIAQTSTENAATDIGTLDKATGDKAWGKKAPYSPYAGQNFPSRPFFGDTHLHTALSLDAGAFGTTLRPRDAYRFAKGNEVVSSSGQHVKLSRPLDFLVVTDHAEQMGLITELIAGKPELLAVPEGRRWYDMITSGKGGEVAIEIIKALGQGKFPKGLASVPGTGTYRSTWREIIDAAEEANQPGRFTAFIGYEWSAMVAGNNLHRNVIFRDGADKASQVEPYPSTPPGSPNPRDLWKWMKAYEDKTGGSVIAIAHNGNLSNGTMFPLIEPANGKSLDREYAETRARWERLYEATQMKGDGETHPFLSPNDEFANFERWDKGNLDMSAKKKPEMLQFEYVRSALKNGLKVEAQVGANPYKFGLVGSTDAHTGLSAVEEWNFFGKTIASEPSAERWEHLFIAGAGGKIFGWETTSSGYAAVWATENTRSAIFDAMKRRETYATTGSRMIVRFFGGWDFESPDANNRMPARIGYTKGVPMGGELVDAPKGKSATFLVAALKDPIGANLDRIQIVKGWLDAKGDVHEKVYDVVWSDAKTRKPGADGKLPPVGNTVDVGNATWTNTIGDPELITVWKDPSFDPQQYAFYYARVIEIPTPRWTAYDAKYFGIKMSQEVPMTTTERAYTSPIWYAPAKK